MSKVTTQLYIVVYAGPAALEQLSAALNAGGPVAAVLISAGVKPLNAADAHPLVEYAQKAGIAVLIDGDAQLARTLRADGVHVRWSPTLAADFAEARDILGNRFMVGVDIASDAQTARHDAMELAEAGADYIGFHVAADDSFDGAGRDLVNWWAEIFEVPCVAFVERLEDIGFAVNPEFLGLVIAPTNSAAAAATLVGSSMAELDPRVAAL